METKKLRVRNIHELQRILNKKINAKKTIMRVSSPPVSYNLHY